MAPSQKGLQPRGVRDSVSEMGRVSKQRCWWHLAAVLDDVPCTSGGVGTVTYQLFWRGSIFGNEIGSLPWSVKHCYCECCIWLNMLARHGKRHAGLTEHNQPWQSKAGIKTLASVFKRVPDSPQALCVRGPCRIMDPFKKCSKASLCGKVRSYPDLQIIKLQTRGSDSGWLNIKSSRVTLVPPRLPSLSLLL